MKSPRKSLDVFEFKEEDELTTEMAVEKFAHKFGNHVAGDGEHSILDHVPGTELQSKENDTGICGVPDAINIDYNHGAIETEDYAKELPEMSHVLQNDFKRHVHDAEDKSNTIEYARIFAGMECSSSSGATVQLEDHSNCVFPVSSCNNEAGTINIFFISKDAVHNDIVRDASVWYEKQEAIESLDVRYKALWNVLLDTGMEKCSTLPEEEAKMLTRSYFPNFDKPFEDVVYPKGDPDAVSISKRDVDLLLPDTFVNDTIIDFYINYLWEEWKERQKGTGEDLYSKIQKLKVHPLELPQQQNLYDCGLFLLHYVELFLEEVSPNFSIYKITPSSKFLQADWFPPGEASMKRAHIERLINDLLDTQSEDCCPPGGNGMHFSPEGPNSAHGYENGVEFSAKSSSLRGCHESSLHQLEQGIEMTLLPASSIRNAQCNQSSGLVLKELFKQASASETFDHAAWGAFEGRASLHEFKRPVSLSEEEVEVGGCFVPTELAEPVFQQLDGVTPEAPVFPHSSGDFRLEPVHQPTSENVASSPVTSGELLNAEDSRGLVEIGDQNGDSFFMKHLPGFCQEANQLQPNHASSHEGLVFRGALTSDEKLDASEHESPFQIVDSKDDTLASKYQGSGGEESLPESDEQRAAKRIRIMPHDSEEDVAGSLSEDLHL
ncbi:UNVERIFIED_CONTAM: putative ubiquitin-like-specific protease 2B [Sesamum angustifolium]|uniref:Ubiquitin-like-specific protease 2B n=1 Tax=Sesamum angustifolium TaxID=2727405 RepID=A0AAW2KME1_9LAMI